MRTERLYIHRAELLRKNGYVGIEKLPEDERNFNLGIKCKLSVVKIDDNNAVCYGWSTGYSCSGFDAICKGAEIYAPKGFSKGNIAFVNAIDKLMGISIRDFSSLDKFLENLDKVDVEDTIRELQGFSFFGFIE